MVSELNSYRAAIKARQFSKITEKISDLSEELMVLIRIADNEWEGLAHDAFRESVISINKDLINLNGDIITISNNILRVAEDCLVKEQREAMLSDGEGYGGGFSSKSDKSGGGGGGGGGGF